MLGGIIGVDREIAAAAEEEWPALPVQIFFCDPVGIESICYRTRANRLINESILIAGLRKIWTGGACRYTKNFHCMLPIEEEQRWTTAYVPVQIFFSPAVVLLSFIIRFVLVREQIDSNTTGWPRKNWTGTQIHWGSCNSHVELNRRRDVKYSQQLLRQKRTSGRLCWIKKDFFKNLSSLTSSHPTFILSPSLPARLSWVSY